MADTPEAIDADTEDVVDTGELDEVQAATMEDFMGKEAARDVFAAPFGKGGKKVRITLVAIGADQYDALLTKHPPTTEQRANGATFNGDTFTPALLEAVCVEPKMKAEQWTKVIKSPNWNRGEISAIFWRALELCNQEVDINPIEAG